MGLNEQQAELCESRRWGFSNPRAIFLNCTLKKSPEMSHTEGLIRMLREIMERNGVETTPTTRRQSQDRIGRVR